MQTFMQTFVLIWCRFLHKKLVINSSNFFCVLYLKKKLISKYMVFRILLFFAKTLLICIVCTTFCNFFKHR